MQYTDSQLREFRDDFARRWRLQLLIVIPFIVLVVLFALIKGLSPQDGPRTLNDAYVIVVLVAAVGTAVFTLYNWRCPACRRYLGRAWNPRFCRHCGIQLRD